MGIRRRIRIQIFVIVRQIIALAVVTVGYWVPQTPTLLSCKINAFGVKVLRVGNGTDLGMRVPLFLVPV